MDAAPGLRPVRTMAEPPLTAKGAPREMGPEAVHEPGPEVATLSVVVWPEHNSDVPVMEGAAPTETVAMATQPAGEV